MQEQTQYNVDDLMKARAKGWACGYAEGRSDGMALFERMSLWSIAMTRFDDWLASRKRA